MAEPFGPPNSGANGRPSLPWEAPVPPATTEKAITKGAPAAMDVTKSGHGMQDVKGRIHRRLLERLNLSNLDKLEREQVVDAIRRVTYELLTQESVPLNFEEREVLVGQVLDEIFGLGPLEPLIQDPEISDILVNTFKQRVHRAARPAREDRRAVPGRPAPAAGHRPDRLGGGPANRRLLADGGRPAAGRLARQRHHPAAGARRAPSLDPQVQARRAERARTCSGRRA